MKSRWGPGTLWLKGLARRVKATQELPRPLLKPPREWGNAARRVPANWVESGDGNDPTAAAITSSAANIIMISGASFARLP